MSEMRLFDLLKHKSAQRPKIVTLCGSTRFSDAFREANLRETLVGHIVLSIGCDTRSDVDLSLGPVDKVALDVLHLWKVELADEVIILNVDGYIGESTRREIAYALLLQKPLRYLVTHRCRVCGKTMRFNDVDEMAWAYEASPFAPCGCQWRFVDCVIPAYPIDC